MDLVGKIRLGEGSTEFRQALRLLTASGEKKILINLAEIHHIDSSGLGELIAAYTNLQKNEGELNFLQLTRRVNELMMITKLLTVFEVYDDEAEAVESFDSPSVKSAFVGV